MFAIDHAATALLVKRRFPTVPIAPLLIAVQAMELAWVVLNYLGVERTTTEPTVRSVADIHLAYMPYSHSVGTALAAALLAWLVIELGFGRAMLGRAVGIGIASHLVLDLLTHARDIVLWPGVASPKLGLGLYASAPFVAFLVEMVYGLACWRLYRGGTGLLAVIVLGNLANLSLLSAAIPGPEVFLAGRPTLAVTLILVQIVVTLILVGIFSRRPASGPSGRESDAANGRRRTPHRLSLLAGLLVLAPPLSAQHAAAVPPPTDPVPAHETFTIESRAVGERRVINVYTPPGYQRASHTAFPVLYMPDGGMAEDFPHVANTIDSLIARGAIRPVIVVGIENTERRRDLTGPTTVASDSAIAPRVGGSAAFRRFIRDELMPAIRSRYRCTDENAIVGESLAGLFVVETLLLEPTLFRRYIAISPSLWWNQDALVHTAAGRLDRIGSAARMLFLTAANEPGIAAESATFAETLEARAPNSLTWRYEPRPQLEHGTIFRAMAPEAFVATLR